MHIRCYAVTLYGKPTTLLLGIAMTFFGLKLSEMENHLLSKIKITKTAFPEETQAIEYGLALMFDLTKDINEALEKDERPQLYANRNLFARNRQLLFNAYFCLLCSHYGTQFVILRTVLENNNLMRLFNLHPQYAFEWLPLNMQNHFSAEIRSKYGKSGKNSRKFKDVWVRNMIFKKEGKEKVEKRIKKVYDELCEYTHPNFRGWRELMGLQRTKEMLLRLPGFTAGNTITVIGLTLYLTQLSFKTCIETFWDYLPDFALQLNEWQENYNKLMIRYME